MQGVPLASKLAVLLRALLFLVFGYVTLQVLAGMLYEAFGLLVASVLGVFAGASIASALVIRIFERGRLAGVGLSWTGGSARNLLLGFAGGFGAATLVVGPALLAGWAAWKPAAEGESGIGTFVFATLVLLFGAAGEEMLFRGYGFQVLVPAFGQAATLLPMSVLFGAVHAANQNVSPLGLVNTVAWGIVLGLALFRAGDLWMPIGLHFGWNWALPLYGVNISGFTMRLTGLTVEWRIAPLWSGGDYGPEGGLLCTLAVAVVAFYLWKAPVAKQRLALTEGPEEK
jgi:membrane protease YdiL (CAAX protease family)